jgi:hypothetical protein
MSDRLTTRMTRKKKDHAMKPVRSLKASRWLTALATIGLGLGTLASCGGGGGGGGSEPPADPPTFAPSATAPAANLVTMTGSSTNDTTLELRVNIGGPSTSSDIFGFAFNLLLSDPSLVQVGTPSAGDALTGNTTASASLQGSRIIVGVTKLGGAGNGVAGASAVVVRIPLRTLKKGSTTIRFTGSSPSTSAADAAALDSNGVKIGTITFDAGSGTLTQN